MLDYSSKYKASFNPHTHEGCDKADKIHVELKQVSIHTPTKGVTFMYYAANSL